MDTKRPDRDEAQSAPEVGAMGLAKEGRQSARYLMEHRAAHLRREADGLAALARAIPEDISPAADGALWRLVNLANMR